MDMIDHKVVECDDTYCINVSVPILFLVRFCLSGSNKRKRSSGYTTKLNSLFFLRLTRYVFFLGIIC